MSIRLPLVIVLGLGCALWVDGRPAHAQSDRREYPALLAGGVGEASIGHIQYPFAQGHLATGLAAESIEVPHLGIRVAVGRTLGRHLSAQLVYLRPAHWVHYRNVNGDLKGHSVWTNVFGLSLATRWSLGRRVSVFGEGGLAAVTRRGFEMYDRPAIEDAVYVAPLAGAGVELALRPHWGLRTSVTYVPGRAALRHPRTVFLSTGITYRVAPVDRRPSSPVTRPRARFARHLIQAGYTTSELGFGFNRAMTPIFWQGDAEVASGLTLHYQHNVFHTERIFSLDWGASVSYNRSRLDDSRFVAVSLYPLLRWTLIRTRAADVYFSYSLAGPTFISEYIIDGQDTGKHFTFQDLLGVGLFTGPGRHVNLEFRIGHYSNANLLPRNAGIRIPLTVNLGVAF